MAKDRKFSANEHDGFEEKKEKFRGAQWRRLVDEGWVTLRVDESAYATMLHFNFLNR
jgi:hypothetical protein